MGKVAVRVPARGWRLVARLLVVVLAGAVAFAPGVTGTEAALAGPMFSHPVSPGQGETHSVSTGHGAEYRGWGAHPVASLRKARTALKKRWQYRLTTWSRWRAERILAALDKQGPAFLVKSGWFRPTWLLVSKDERGLVRITRKGQLGGPKDQAEDQVVDQYLSSDEAREVLAGQLNLIPRISRVWSQAERFAEPIEALKKPGTTSVVITETPGGGAKIPPVSWRIGKSQIVKNGEHAAVTVTLARLDDQSVPSAANKDRNLSIEEVITRLAEHFGVGSAVRVSSGQVDPELKDAPLLERRSPETTSLEHGSPENTSLGEQKATWEDDREHYGKIRETKLGTTHWRDIREIREIREIRKKQLDRLPDRIAEAAATNLRSAKPSWGGEFSQEVDDKDQAVALAFAYGPGARVEVVVPILHQQGIARYGIENLGGGQLRITDVGDGGREIARGYLHRDKEKYELSDPVYKWFNEMLAHVRYAHKPGTGRDLTRLEDVFSDRSTGFTRSPTTPPYPTWTGLEQGTLLPAGALTREVKLLIQDRLLQGKSINLMELLKVVDLEKAFSTYDIKAAFAGISVRALAKEAGEITGVRVLGIARDDESKDLFTVVAVDGQLAFYDQDRNLRDHVADLLADSRVELLRTTDKETYTIFSPLEPTSFAELSPHTWTPVTSWNSVRLAETLGPGQTIDIIRTKESQEQLYPEVFRINRPDNTDNYRIYKIGDRKWKEENLTRDKMWNFVAAYAGVDNVYVRPVEPTYALNIPGVEESDLPRDASTPPPDGTADYDMLKFADPYLVKAVPGTAPRTNRPNELIPTWMGM